MPDGAMLPDEDRIEAVVRQILVSMTGDLTAKEAVLLAELTALGRTVARVKSEIAALQVDDITGSHIPSATDELDAIVENTAKATNEILDVCELLEQLQGSMPAEAAQRMQDAVTRIYEACSFQDITGQRIGKVVGALKAIEARVEAVTGAAGGRVAAPAAPAAPNPSLTEGQALANGPQLPGAGVSQEEIDRLLASFD
jgi:chemotaxis protein CheZ